MSLFYHKTCSIRHMPLKSVCLLSHWKEEKYISCCSHTKEEIDMYLRQMSCYMLPSVCLLPHKRENIHVSFIYSCLWRKEKDINMLPMSSNDPMLVLVKDIYRYHYSSAGGCTSWLMSSCNNYYYGSNSITSGFKLQQMKWHIFIMSISIKAI